jgi:hypothetical protein
MENKEIQINERITVHDQPNLCIRACIQTEVSLYNVKKKRNCARDKLGAIYLRRHNVAVQSSKLRHVSIHPATGHCDIRRYGTPRKKFHTLW